MKRFLNKAYTQLEKYLIYLLFSSKCWTWTKFLRLLSGYQKNTLSLPKHGNITPNSMTKTREKWDFFSFSLPDFRMIWRCPGIQCVSFFCLEPTVKKDTLMRMNSFIKTWVNIMKCKSIKVFGPLSVAQKSHPALRRTLHKNRWHFTYFYTHLFLSNKSSF